MSGSHYKLAMPKHITIEAEVGPDGKFYGVTREWWNYIAEEFRGQKVTITISEEHPKRTMEQSGYFESVVLPRIMEELTNASGWENANHRLSRDRAEVKAMLVHTVYSDKVNIAYNKETKGVIVKPIKTSELDTKDYGDLTRRAVWWAERELGITIPPPDKKWKENHSPIKIKY